MADQLLRVRFVVDALVNTRGKPLDWNQLAMAAQNAGTAVRVQAFEGVVDVDVSFLEHHKEQVWVHLHDSTDDRCEDCVGHADDELGTEYTN